MCRVSSLHILGVEDYAPGSMKVRRPAGRLGFFAALGLKDARGSTVRVNPPSNPHTLLVMPAQLPGFLSDVFR